MSRTPARQHGGGLTAVNLYRFFRTDEEETLALRGVSLTAAPGEFVAVIGPSGSGKSTLLSCLSGGDEPDGGYVHIAGEQVSHRPEHVRSGIRARHIGLLRERENLFDHLTIAENVTLAQSFGSSQPPDDPAGLLGLVGIARRGRGYPGELSGGELARAGLAVALANRPTVLLADEPTGELDSLTEGRILQLLVATARRGAAVLVASHSTEVAAAADRLVRLHDGMLA